jgi:hypothetical protein
MPSSYVAVLRAVNAGEPARTTRFPSLTGGTQLIEAATASPPLRTASLEHDPEKWIPVLGKDHAPTIK